MQSMYLMEKQNIGVCQEDKKKSFWLSEKEPQVEVNFSQRLKVTMKILYKHLKWNRRSSDQNYPKTPPHPTSNLLKIPSCLLFLAEFFQMPTVVFLYMTRSIAVGLAPHLCLLPVIAFDTEAWQFCVSIH